MKNTNWRTPLYIFCTGFILMSQVFVFANTSYATTLTPTSIAASVNQVRTDHRLSPLATNPLLTTAANNRLQDMLARNYFAHQSPDGAMPWDVMSDAGYQYTFAGENLAMDYLDTQETITAWLNSRTHRQNILSNNFRDTGVAVASSGGHIYVVQIFGTSESSQRTNPSPATARQPINNTIDNSPSIIPEDEIPENQAVLISDPSPLPKQNSIITVTPPSSLLTQNEFTAFNHL